MTPSTSRRRMRRWNASGDGGSVSSTTLTARLDRLEVIYDWNLLLDLAYYHSLFGRWELRWEELMPEKV